MRSADARNKLHLRSAGSQVCRSELVAVRTGAGWRLHQRPMYSAHSFRRSQPSLVTPLHCTAGLMFVQVAR